MGVVNRTDINEGKNIDIVTAVGLKKSDPKFKASPKKIFSLKLTKKPFQMSSI